jgi:hypothetical protein
VLETRWGGRLYGGQFSWLPGVINTHLRGDRMSGDNGDGTFYSPAPAASIKQHRTCSDKEQDGQKVLLYPTGAWLGAVAFLFSKKERWKGKDKEKWEKRGWKKRSPPLSLFWRPKVPPAHNVFSKKPAPETPGFFVVVRAYLARSYESSGFKPNWNNPLRLYSILYSTFSSRWYTQTSYIYA